MELITGQDNPILRQKSRPVEHLNQEVYSLIGEMKRLIHENDGVGLAAIQVGRPSRIIVISDPDRNKDLVFINPEIIKQSRETETLAEGCLSLPNYENSIARPIRIILKATTEDGKKIKFKASHLLARIIGHEIDHLEGILISDYPQTKP